MLTLAELNILAERLRKIVPSNSKIKYDPIDRFWSVKYEDGEFEVEDCYRYTSNLGMLKFSTIKTEI